jgi:hypothetical protein
MEHFKQPPASISTGVPELDGLAAGGFPRGHLSEIYGPPGVGLSRIGLKAAASACEEGLRVLHVDFESCTPWQVEDCGLLQEHPVVSVSPTEAVDGAQAVIDAIKAGVDLVILSRPSLGTVEALAYAPNDKALGLRLDRMRFWSIAFQRMATLLHKIKSPTAVVVLSTTSDEVRSPIAMRYITWLRVEITPQGDDVYATLKRLQPARLATAMGQSAILESVA